MTDDHSDGPTDHTERMATDGGTDGTAETPIEADVIDSAASDADVPRKDLADVLVVLNASLIGSHSTYEDEYDYVTVEGVRAYVVDATAWETLREEHDLDARLARAARHAHTEQTRRLLSRAGDDRASEAIDAGIVIGIDTAEVMN